MTFLNHTSSRSIITTFFQPKPLCMALSVLLVSACSSTPTKTPVYRANPSVSQTTDTDDLAEMLSATDMSAVESSQADVLKYGDLWDRIRAGFAMDLSVHNTRIEQQKKWFITRQPYIDRLSARASRYIYYTVAEAERRGIPTELALLPVIESSYDPTATSNAAAAGMWQFIPSTGRIYGLRQTQTYDGRRDVIESTRAAYDFLTSLYNKFGSWELALAAYNAGPGRVNKAIRANKKRGLPTDFWSLSLPKETMNYVPRFLAVAKIVRSPQAHGIYLTNIANRPHFRSVPIQGGVSLSSVSQVTGISQDVLYDLNPALIAGYTDIEGPNRLLVPKNMARRFDKKISDLKGYGFASDRALIANENRLPVQTLDDSQAKELMTAAQNTPVNNAPTPAPVTYADQSVSDQMVSQTVVTSQDADVTAAALRKAFYASKNALPKSSSALAAFVTNSRVPNQTTSYIQPKTTTAQQQLAASLGASAVGLSTDVSKPIESGQTDQTNVNNTQAAQSTVTQQPTVPANTNQQFTQPSETEKQRLQTQVLANINALPTSAAKVTQNETVVQFPALSKQEREKIAAEIKQADPSVENVIDPIDGEIKLEAIQTQQSILAAQGKERKLTFTAPKQKPTPSKPSVKKPTGKRTVYTVKAGDSLKKIGEKHGLYWRDIANWNQIDLNANLYIGTPLYLYGAKTPIKTQKLQAKPTRYRVQAGDTLIGVANRFGLTPSQLASYNGMQALDDLIIGKTLVLVKPKGVIPTDKTTQATVSDQQKQVEKSRSSKQTRKQTKLYRVRSGEGLIQLAKRFNMTTRALASLNNLSESTNLQVGQRLKVPSDVDTRAPKPTHYRVKAGDTMIGVAAKFGMSASQLAQRNNMKALDDLVIGQNLQLTANTTGTKGTISQKIKSKATQPRRNNVITYRVQAGEGLIQLAKRFDVSTQALATFNGISPNKDLHVGQRLKIPKQTNRVSRDTKLKKPRKKPTHYRVKSGDTLLGVANKFDLSPRVLAKLNGMKPLDDLRIGQRLQLVATARSAQKGSRKQEKTKKSKHKKPTHYVVESGDTMIYVARKFGISTNKLAKYNGMKPSDDLRIGQRLALVEGQGKRVGKPNKAQTGSKKNKTKQSGYVSYTVKSGDGLIALARKHGISVEKLAKINKMKPTDNLILGKRIKLPK